MTGYTMLKPEKLSQINPNDGVIIDVRTSMEHAEKHLTCGHTHIPLDELNPADFMLRQGLGKASKVYILCRSGKRAAVAAEKFSAAGYNNVHVIEGGMIACEDYGHDIQGHAANTNAQSVQIKGPITLERQVRIVAGAIAAGGALLGLVINPLFSIIPLLVGCGLIFAGVTDRCGMALILTKAPWNKMAKAKNCQSCS